MTEIIALINNIHRPVPQAVTRKSFIIVCKECKYRYPCKTVKAVKEYGTDQTSSI